MQNKFKIIDESGDRKYFTIIPNYIVNHSTIYEQAIYLYMKRVAGENGTCWSSAQEIGEQLGCARNTVSKYRNKLVKRGWIKCIGKKGRTRPTDEYKIVDLWELNVNFYAKKDSSTVEQSKKDSSTGEKIVQPVNKDSSTGGHAIYVEEEPIKKNQEEEPTIQPANAVGLLVTYFFELKGWTTKEVKQVIFKRYVRPAKELLTLCDNSLEEAKLCLEKVGGWAKSRDLDWSIETVFKKWYDIDHLKEKEKKPYINGLRAFQRVEGGKWYVISRDGEIREFGSGNFNVVWT